VAAPLLVLTVIAGVAFAAGLTVASKNLTVLRTCVVSATPAGSTAETDAYVNQNAANTNNGTGNFVDVQTGSGQNRRTYVRFDLAVCAPAIPSTATVKLATVRLYATQVPTACHTYDIFDAASTWSETGITWNNQPFGTTLNNPASGTRTDAITIGGAPCQNTATGAYVNGWTVTVDVQRFVAGTQTNFGWMIRDDAENVAPTDNARFATRELGNVSRVPQLTVSWTP
jgi:hypothetical protein